jgi:hypothetical protein
MIVDEFCPLSTETVISTLVSIEDLLVDGKTRLLVRGPMKDLVELNTIIRRMVDLGTVVLHPEMLKVIKNERTDLSQNIGVSVDFEFDRDLDETIER